MARLDRFLTLMREQAADGLRLAPGQPIELRKNGLLRPVTREPLNEQQVMTLLREITPPQFAERLGTNAEFAFTYDWSEGAIEVQVEPNNGGQSASLRSLFPPAPNGKPAQPEAVPANGSVSAEQGGPRDRIDQLFRRMAEEGGSDLHLRVGRPPIVRKDGNLVTVGEVALGGEDIELMLRAIMPAGDFTTWRESGDADFAHEVPGVGRFRGNAARDRMGPVGVFRMISSRIRTTQELGLSPEVQALCQLTKGLVLVTGPTGSGKSTTLAALVDLVNSTRADHVITIEDPIEYVHLGKKALITQRQVGIHSRSFKSALRAALREDPDVMLVGELRDLETVAIALETAETGHLVFGTLHTTTAASTVDRIIDQFPADRQSQVRVMLSESLRGVVAQTLCRKIGGGRVAAYEVLLSNSAIANLIREGKTFQIPSIMQTNRRSGMMTMADSLMELVDKGLIEPREAYLKAVDKTAITTMLKNKGFPTNFTDGG